MTVSWWRINYVRYPDPFDFVRRWRTPLRVTRLSELKIKKEKGKIVYQVIRVQVIRGTGNQENQDIGKRK